MGRYLVLSPAADTPATFRARKIRPMHCSYKINGPYLKVRGMNHVEISRRGI